MSSATTSARDPLDILRVSFQSFFGWRIYHTLIMTPMRGRSLAAILAVMIVSLIIHGNAIRGWWLWDDPQLVIEAIRQPAIGTLFDPSEYSHLATHTFTPLLLLSFKTDILVAGIRPAVFYAHQIAVLTLAAVLLFLLLRRYVSDWFAIAGSAIFLTTWASVYAARMLMIRHYVEGLVFALAALLAWSFGKRWIAMAAIFYLLAMLSKEVYAPIPLFFICQSRYDGRPWREIAKEMILPAAALLIFLAWRFYMIGLLGASPSVLESSEVTDLPGTLWGQLIGPGALWPNIIWALAVVAVFGFFIARHRANAIAFLIIATIVVVAPIVPVVAAMQWRYSFAFVAFVVAALTIAAGTTGRWTIAVLLLLLATTTVTSIAQRRYYRQVMGRGIQREGQYVWTQPPSAPTLAATSPPWYLGGLAWLRKNEGRGQSPQFVFSKYAITVGGYDPKRIVMLDRRGNVTPVNWQSGRENFDPEAPLSIEFAIRNHEARWRFSPPAGRFVFLTEPGYSAIPIPPNGAQRVASAREPQFFRIVREQTDGRWTVSPRLPIPAEGAVTRWSH
ncbi:MAG TPA: hypothetical protein VGA33_07930 [Thermoanaerobaculia bacterium]